VAHAACVVTEQNVPMALARQHAPRAVGGGQTVAWHAVPDVQVPPILSQPRRVVSRHARAAVLRIGLQHAPRAAQTSTLWHVVPFPR